MIPWQTNAKCSCITTICKMSHKGGINLKHQGNSQLSESIPLQN